MTDASDNAGLFIDERHWVPAFAGTTLTGIVDYQSSSPAVDDASTTTVVPMKIGTQRLSL